MKPPTLPQGELLAHYAAALETILMALPGQPIINGHPMPPALAIVDLRARFMLEQPVVDAIERGRLTVTAR